MKVAINCAFYQPKGGGIKEYIDNLVNNFALFDTDIEIVIYVLEDQIEFAKKNLSDKFRIKSIPYQSKTKWDRIKRSLFEQDFWKREEEIERFDIFHSPFFHSPSLKKAKVLLTVHDLRLYRFPETYEFFRYQFLKKKVKKSIRNADHIIAISKFTKDETVELCGVSPEKITVIHEAINLDRFSSKEITDVKDIPAALKENPFLLSVGHMEPRKNYDRLIDAFNSLKKTPEFSDLQLVLVGKKDHSYKSTLEKIAASEGVHYLNFVDYTTLLWLYGHTSLFVFPSIYEGFGFPPLEAGAMGGISAVSNVSSIPEVCGDAAIYFDPYDVQSIINSLEKGLKDKELRKELTERLKNRLEEFSWKRNAEETLNLYKSLR